MVLALLWDIKVGRMVALAPLEDEWEGLEEIALWSEETEGQDEEREKGGTCQP